MPPLELFGQAVRLFGRAIKKLRKAVVLTQAKLAEQGDLLSATFVGDIERGKKEASLKTIHRLALGLSIPPWDIMFLAATDQFLRVDLQPTDRSSPWAPAISLWSWRPAAEGAAKVMEAIQRPGYGSPKGGRQRVRALIVVSRTRDGYAAHVPYLPACAAVGPTLEGVVAAMGDAITDWLRNRPPLGSASEPSSFAMLLDVAL